MSTTKHEVKLNFKRSDDGDFGMTVPDCKTDLPDATIKTAGQAIVDANAFEPDGFAIVSLASAQKIDTTTTDVDLSE